MSRSNRLGRCPRSRQAGTELIVGSSLHAVLLIDGGPDATCGLLVSRGASRPGSSATGLQIQEPNTGCRDRRVGLLPRLRPC